MEIIINEKSVAEKLAKEQRRKETENLMERLGNLLKGPLLTRKIDPIDITLKLTYSEERLLKEFGHISAPRRVKVSHSVLVDWDDDHADYHFQYDLVPDVKKEALEG